MHLVIFLKVWIKKNETTSLLPISWSIDFSQKSEKIRSKWNVFIFNLRYSTLLEVKYDQSYDEKPEILIFQKVWNFAIVCVNSICAIKKRTTSLLCTSWNTDCSQKTDKIRSKGNVFSFDLRYTLLLNFMYDRFPLRLFKKFGHSTERPVLITD